MKTSYKTTPIIVRTSVDEIGSLVDTERIASEDLYSYSKRIYDTYANRAGSNYEGLINAINRDLNLKKEEVIRIKIRSIIMASIDNDVTITNDILEDNHEYTGLVNGTSVIAIGNSLKDISQEWEDNTLRGYSLVIDNQKYNILSNSQNEIFINGTLSNLLGLNYIIKPQWEDGELTGMGLRINDRLYKIIENTENQIRVDRNFETDTTDIYEITSYNPKVEVTASKMLLYKEYFNSNNYQLEKAIDLRNDVTFHSEIVDEINKLKHFEAEDISENKNVFSYTLKKQSTEKKVINEIVPATRFFRLENGKIKEGSISFTESNIFLSEVSESDISNRAGNYHVDYDKGIVKVKSLPAGNKTVSYTWNDFPFNVIASPAIVNPLAKPDTQEYLFSQQEMQRYNNYSEQFISSQPKADMLEFISELLTVNSQSWGA